MKLPPYFWCDKDKIHTHEEYLSVLSQHPNCIQFIPNPSDDMIMTAIDSNPYVIQHLEQTEKGCLLAVAKDGKVLQFIKDKTKEICEVAIRNYPYAIQYVSKAHKDYAYLKELSEKLMPHKSYEWNGHTILSKRSEWDNVPL